MNYKNITIAGGGVLGSQIAFQSAYCGFNVTIYSNDQESKNETIKKIDNLKETYINTINSMNESNWASGLADLETFDKDECLNKVLNAYNNIKIELDLKESLKDADLLIESIPENINIKGQFYEGINSILPEKTVVVTNSSTLLPSVLSKYLTKPQKFLALHFANNIWKNNTAEIMGHDKTDKRYFDEIVEFANSIRMVALKINKEKSGYLLNSMLVPFLLCAMDLLANEISDVETIDKTWKLATGAPKGPFEIIDIVGLITAKNIVEEYIKVPSLLNPLFKKMMFPYNYKKMLDLLNKYISENKLGKSTNEGFYKYDKQ